MRLTLTKRQKETLDYIDHINNTTDVGSVNHHTVGPRGRTVKMLDMRVVRALKRKGLIALVYPNSEEHLESEFWPVLTTAGEEVMFKLFTSSY